MKYSVVNHFDLVMTSISGLFSIQYIKSVHAYSCRNSFIVLIQRNLKFWRNVSWIRKGSCSSSYVLIAIVHSKGLSVSMVTIPELS